MRRAVNPRHLVTRPARRVLASLGYEIRQAQPREPRDFQPAEVKLWQEVAPYTMTTPGAIIVLAHAVRHVVSCGLSGAMVECGVWKGGSMLAIAKTLLDLGRPDVDLYLFDTFEGMPPPMEKDVLWTGDTAEALLAREQNQDTSMIWARASLGQVQEALETVPFPVSKLHFVEGRIEETIPDKAPKEISLLRLDTDWYESTKHELTHLYPRLVRGGILMIDDYGWWRGAQEATDEYFDNNPPTPFLVRIDDGGCRIAIKP